MGKRLTKIYTRTGDDGTTGLADGSRRAKHQPRLEAVGAVDEANSALGLAAVALAGSPHAGALARIQNDLFDLGADLATPDGVEGALRIVAEQVAWLERAIDALNADLPPLTSFILPGGTEAAGRIHVARAAVRRAERAMCALAAVEPMGPEALRYANRLSDYLFVLARVVNAAAGGDILWVPGRNR